MENKELYDNDTSTRGSAEFDFTIRMTLGFLYSFMILLTVVGNFLVVAAVGFYRRMRNCTNYIVMSLAVADLTVAFLVMPFSLMYDIFGKWPFGWTFCYFWRSCDVMCCTASILHICCIALDRFWAIINPLNYRNKMTNRRLCVMISSSWGCSIAISFVPIYLGWFTDDLSTLYKDMDNCDLTVNIVYAILSSCTSFFIPFTFLTVAYAYILRIAKRQAHALKLQESAVYVRQDGTIKMKQQFNRRHTRDNKAIQTLGIIMGIFSVSWLPFFLMYIIMPFCPSCQLSLLQVSLITWLGYANSCMNPFIYAYMNRDFRAAFKKLIFCDVSGKHRSYQDSNTSL
ncbi:octopamine receptor-like [Liolophura sinensis]|uniref:octopamine receptor-like n=1 Tax=Liolophura sinensis TaxID=3198878 RepID=UPI003158C399